MTIILIQLMLVQILRLLYRHPLRVPHQYCKDRVEARIDAVPADHVEHEIADVSEETPRGVQVREVGYVAAEEDAEGGVSEYERGREGRGTGRRG